MTLELAALLTVALAVGYLAGRLRRRRIIDAAATATYDTFVAGQIADDRAALHTLPPGLDAGAVYAHAATRGISIADAARELFTLQARARLEANLDRHHRRRS